MNIFANRGGNKENIENAGKRKDGKERSAEFQFIHTSKEQRSQTKYKSKEFHENNNNNNNGPGYNYIDYSTIDEDAFIASKGLMTKMKGGLSSLFPQKLHNILVDQGIHADIISWAPHGRCFIIHQPKQFVKIVLPELFQITKKTSFTRQLNLYGFVRLWDGHDEGGYYHEKFLRSKSKLCKLIKRKPLKGCKRNFCPLDYLQDEPKFYSMPYLPKINHSTTSTSLSASTAASGSSGNDTSASYIEVIFHLQKTMFANKIFQPRKTECKLLTIFWCLYRQPKSKLTILDPRVIKKEEQIPFATEKCFTYTSCKSKITRPTLQNTL